MAEDAHDEAIKGNNPERERKARSYIYSIVPLDMQTQYRHIPKEIEDILFPSGAQTPRQVNDVRIVFNAAYYMSILVTNDGDSSTQPNGILGNRDKLTKFVQVMQDSKAVELVKERIRQRDKALFRNNVVLFIRFHSGNLYQNTKVIFERLLSMHGRLLQ